MKRSYPVSQPSITEAEVASVSDAVASGWVSSLGKYITEFEEAFAKFCGTKYAVTVSNGTTGIHLALEALGIGKGDEVIMPDLSFIATANAVTYAGGVPVMVDIDPNTLCIDPKEIRKAITPKTKAIMPVHLYGHPAEMDEINSIAKEFDLLVIEDAAESHGATYKGARAGSLGHCGIFSFYGNKIITTGEGGAITTNDPELYKRAKFLRDHAMSQEKRYWHPEIGFNYRMTNIQAALGVAQLKRIDDILQHRQDLMKWYAEVIDTSSSIRLNHCNANVQNSYWMICLEADFFDEAIKAKFMEELKKEGVDTRPYFFPMSYMPMYPDKDSPVSKHKSLIGINLPTYYGLSEEDVQYIGLKVNEQIAKVKTYSQPELS